MNLYPISTIEYEKSGEGRYDKMIIKHSLAKTFLFIGMIAVTVFGGYPQSAIGLGFHRGGTAPEYHSLSGNPM